MLFGTGSQSGSGTQMHYEHSKALILKNVMKVEN